MAIKRSTRTRPAVDNVAAGTAALYANTTGFFNMANGGECALPQHNWQLQCGRRAERAVP